MRLIEPKQTANRKHEGQQNRLGGDAVTRPLMTQRTKLGSGSKPSTRAKRGTGPLDLANPEGFVGIPVPHWVLSQKDLTPAAKLLYGYLLQRYRDEVKCAFPSQKDIAERLACSPRWVRELTDELVKGGFIHVARRKLQLRTWKRPSLQTCYSFLKHPGMEKAQRTRRRNEQDHIEATLRAQEGSTQGKTSSGCLRNSSSGDPRVAWED